MVQTVGIEQTESGSAIGAPSLTAGVIGKLSTRLSVSRAIKPDNTGGYDWCILDPNQKIVGEAFEHVGYGNGGSFEWRPAEANARLWAASPELLECVGELKELFRFALLSTSPGIAKDGMEFIRKAEAAIAKATGAA